MLNSNQSRKIRGRKLKTDGMTNIIFTVVAIASCAFLITDAQPFDCYECTGVLNTTHPEPYVDCLNLNNTPTVVPCPGKQCFEKGMRMGTKPCMSIGAVGRPGGIRMAVKSLIVAPELSQEKGISVDAKNPFVTTTPKNMIPEWLPNQPDYYYSHGCHLSS